MVPGRPASPERRLRTSAPVASRNREAVLGVERMVEGAAKRDHGCRIRIWLSSRGGGVGGAPPPRFAIAQATPLSPTMQPQLHIFSHNARMTLSNSAKSLLLTAFCGNRSPARRPAGGCTPACRSCGVQRRLQVRSLDAGRSRSRPGSPGRALLDDRPGARDARRAARVDRLRLEHVDRHEYRSRERGAGGLAHLPRRGGAPDRHARDRRARRRTQADR